jgi:predicted RNA methylase
MKQSKGVATATKGPRRPRKASGVVAARSRRLRRREPTAAQLVQRRGYAARPWRCAVLAVDTAGRSGWSFRVAGVQSAFGETETKDGESVSHIVRWAVQEAGELPLVLVLETPYGGGREMLLALGAARERWAAAWRAADMSEKRIVSIMPSRWRRHVLGPAYVRMQRDEIRKAEQVYAARVVGEKTGPDESAAILIGMWAERAPEVGEALGPNARQMGAGGEAANDTVSTAASVHTDTAAHVQPSTDASVHMSTGASVLMSSPARQLEREITLEAAQKRALWSQWYTPPWLATLLWDWASRRDQPETVLEPSSGEGALILPILADPRGCAAITCVDIDQANVRKLAKLCRDRQVPTGLAITAHCGDFRRGALPDGGAMFDLCLMNPPYEDGQAEAFILHALTMARRVCGIFKASILHGQGRYETLWRHAQTTREVRLKKRPSFGKSDRGTTSPKNDYVALEIVLRPPGDTAERMVEVESWG